jgi:hypothetical protein
VTVGWTRVDDIVDTLRKRWERGLYLRNHAQGVPWEPVVLPVRAPRAADLADRFDEVVAWNERFRRDSTTRSGRPRFDVEYRTISGRGLGANSVPARVRIDTLEQLCELLGTTDDLAALESLTASTDSAAPGLSEWVRTHPMVVLTHRHVWRDLLATVTWIAAHDTSVMYLRHVDVPSVDTKFIERHHQVLGRLLTTVLPSERVDLTAADFATRFGFRSKPDYTRLRLLSPVAGLPAQLSEWRVRTDELAQLDLGVSRVFVVENEASYLAFPAVADAIVVFGEGFHVTSLSSIPWLAAKEIVYWGDIDTHGLSILNQLRVRFPHVRSILMDTETLLAHRTQIVTEPNPTAGPQAHLTDAEQALYRDLIEDRFGPNVRLEQERVRFSCVRDALRPWMSPGGSAAHCGVEHSADVVQT